MRTLLAFVIVSGLASAAERPNVLLVMTDDQGYGDLGVHGNSVIRTPNLDQFARESVWLKNFYVSPVCSPTRSSLLTGLYNYRTGIVDTFVGRSQMRTGIPTLAEHLQQAGYRTGLFGKWHLGDSYPLRPEDRGFSTTLWHRGGGLAQPADPPGTNFSTAYFDPILVKNGQESRTRGYCTDIFTNGAVEFIRANEKQPFFAYVAYNAPHGPYQVPEKYLANYASKKLGPDAFPKIGQPWAGKKLDTDSIARAYGMIENIDENFAKLMEALKTTGQLDNTIVIFLTDNGPGGVRFNAGLRNRKGTVYEGGIRVPCYMRWPARLKSGFVQEMPLAHIDMVPTLLAACDAKPEKPVQFDGRNFLPLLTEAAGAWEERTLYFQWHRGDIPEEGRAFAARGPQYKLVQAAGVPENAKWTRKYELFDVASDPFEEHDLAAEQPKIVERMLAEYKSWFADVTRAGFAPLALPVGTKEENPVRLSRQDWRGVADWGPKADGYWLVNFARPGTYRFTVYAATPGSQALVRLVSESAGIVEEPSKEAAVAREQSVIVQIKDAGPRKLSGWLVSTDKRQPASHIQVHFLEQ